MGSKDYSLASCGVQSRLVVIPACARRLCRTQNASCVHKSYLPFKSGPGSADGLRFGEVDLLKAAIVSPQVVSPAYAVEDLLRRARQYAVEHLERRFVFDEQAYVRRILHWGPDLEVVLLCWGPGQSSAIHDHQGSNCVTRVLSGRFLERRFCEDEASGLYLEVTAQTLGVGDVSGMDGQQVHQMTNALVRDRGALLNFYSPAFSPPPRIGTGRYLTISSS
jgi:hypothetical protein